VSFDVVDGQPGQGFARAQDDGQPIELPG